MKKTMTKQISIIMPAYNRGGIISRAIDSVLNQSISSFELLIVDDASDDGTQQVIKAYHDKRIRYLRNSHRQGASFSRNRGMEKAAGEYIAFLDTDNEWKPDYLKNRIYQIEALDSDIAFGRVEKWNEGVVSNWPETKITAGILEYDFLIRAMCIYNPMDTNSVVMKRKCFEEMGGFDVSFVRLQDWEYFFRLVQNGKYKVSFDDAVSVILYIQPDSIANNGKFWEMRLKLLESQMDTIFELDAVNELIDSFEICPEEGGFSKQQLDTVFSMLLGRGRSTAVKELFWNQRLELREQKQIIQSKDCCIDNLEHYIENQRYGFKRDNKIFACYEKWMINEFAGRGIIQALEERNAANIVIYGMGYLGRTLTGILKESQVRILGIIDRNPETNVTNLKCISDLAEIGTLGDMDIIIVTAINDFAEIYSELKEYTDIPIVSLESLAAS